jgi:hypothetical protein
MGDTVVQRRRKYGKDRLYINADDGTRIGWHDVLTGEDLAATVATRPNPRVATSAPRADRCTDAAADCSRRENGSRASLREIRWTIRTSAAVPS